MLYHSGNPEKVANYQAMRTAEVALAKAKSLRKPALIQEKLVSIRDKKRSEYNQAEGVVTMDTVGFSGYLVLANRMIETVEGDLKLAS